MTEISGTLGNPSELSRILRLRVADLLGCDVDEIDSVKEFTSYGLSSIEGLSLLGDLEDLVGLELPDSLLWDFPTLEKLTQHLLQQLEETKKNL